MATQGHLVALSGRVFMFKVLNIFFKGLPKRFEKITFFVFNERNGIRGYKSHESIILSLNLSVTSGGRNKV